MVQYIHILKNSQGYKVSNWCNDWITFKPGEIFRGIFEKGYNLVYGFGYTKLYEEEEKIKKQMDIFVPNDENIKIQYIQVENTSKKEKDVHISYYIDPVLGVTNETTATHIISKIENDILYFKNPYNVDFSEYVSFLTGVCDDESINIDIMENYGVSVSFKIAPNEKKEFAIILGAMEQYNSYALDIKNKYMDLTNISKTYEKTKKYWEEKVVRNFKTI